MSVYTGEEAKAYYVEEATYGTTPANPAMLYIGVITPIEPGLDPKNIVIRGIGSRTPQAIRKTVRQIDLSFTYVPRDWDFWAYVTNKKSVSLEVLYDKDPTFISLNHKGMKVDKGKVEASIEGPVKISVGLMGQDLAVGTAKIGASYEAEPSTLPITGLDCVIKKGTTEITRFSDFSFEILNNLKRQPVIRSTTPHLIKALPERHQILAGTIRADFESKDELDDIINDTEFNLVFEIGPTGNKKTFTFGGCKWRSAKTPTKIEDLVAQNLEWEAKTLTET